MTPETPTTLEPENIDIEIPGVELEDNVELVGVDEDDNENPQIVEINDDLDIPAQYPPLIEFEPAIEAAIEIEPVATLSSIEDPSLRRSTRVRS